MFPAKDKMRAHYWKLMDDRDELLKESAPLREKREALKEKMAPLEKESREIRDAIIKIERPRLPEIDQERAMIQKALNGAVGERKKAPPVKEPA